MLARRRFRRRIEDALAVASPLALVEAMDAHLCSRSPDDVRDLIERSVKRMESGERAQLELYLNLEEPDDLLAHRFSAFLRQNPRAIAALDPQAVDAILAQLGEIPMVEHLRRRLPARAWAFVALVVAVAVLPLAAQYAHQRGLLQGLDEPVVPPAIVPFVERIGALPVPAAPQKHRAAQKHHARQKHRARRIAHHAPKHVRRRIASNAPAHHRRIVYRARWSHPFVADASQFGVRARLSVRSYLHALVEGNLPAALSHLGIPADGDTSALTELPIVTRSTNVEILGSRPQTGGNEQVQAEIRTGEREYYEVFDVARDGPAMRIVDRYYIPVNRRAQVAVRLFVQRSH